MKKILCIGVGKVGAGGDEAGGSVRIAAITPHRRVPGMTGSRRFLAVTPSFFSKRRTLHLSRGRHKGTLRSRA
ncbi:hypothetical protein G3N57_15160 [Paraburkholderia sp. Se-20369]|nr:hypothetical protein [Paraburkholderia sp. Se-20369]